MGLYVLCNENLYMSVVCEPNEATILYNYRSTTITLKAQKGSDIQKCEQEKNKQ